MNRRLMIFHGCTFARKSGGKPSFPTSNCSQSLRDIADWTLDFLSWTCLKDEPIPNTGRQPSGLTYFFSGNSVTLTKLFGLRYVFAACLIVAASSFL